MVTTHFQDEAEYCDRVVLVYHGRLIAEGSPDDLKDRARSRNSRIMWCSSFIPCRPKSCPFWRNRVRQRRSIALASPMRPDALRSRWHLPVFQAQCGHPAELSRIGADQRETSGPGMTRQKDVVGPDHAALRFE